MERVLPPILGGLATLLIAIVVIIYNDGQNDAELQIARQEIIALKAWRETTVPEFSRIDSTQIDVRNTLRQLAKQPKHCLLYTSPSPRDS